MSVKSMLLASALAISAALHAFADKANDTLVAAINKEIQTLDGLYSTATENLMLSFLTSDQLVEIDLETGEFVGALAESYTQVDDTTIDFTLRDGLTFHDGSPVTVEDIIYSFEWVAAEDSKTSRGAFIREWFESAVAVDERTVRVTSKSPYPLMLRDISVFVQTRKAGSYKDGNPDALTQELNGTGPYKVVSFDMGSGVTLERFDGYYSGGPKAAGSIKTIVLRPIPDWGTITAELLAGGVNWSYDVPDDTAQDLGQLPMVELVAGMSPRVAFLVLDAAGVSGPDGPLTKKLVRQALNHAVNRAEIVEFLVGGTGRVIHSTCNLGMFGCDVDVTEYAYDPEMAKKLLAEAGFPDGFAFELTAYRERPVMEAVAADLAEVGVTANINYVKLSALEKSRSNGELVAFQNAWGFYATPDLGAISNYYVEGSDRNLNHDAEVEGWFKAALETVDPQERADLYARALKKVADEAYLLPLYQYSQNYVVSADVVYEPSADGLARLNEMSWK
jgi:peptide/nickel transport system substrate-binding protein